MNIESPGPLNDLIKSFVLGLWLALDNLTQLREDRRIIGMKPGLYTDCKCKPISEIPRSCAWHLAWMPSLPLSITSEFCILLCSYEVLSHYPDRTLKEYKVSEDSEEEWRDQYTRESKLSSVFLRATQQEFIDMSWRRYSIFLKNWKLLFTQLQSVPSNHLLNVQNQLFEGNTKVCITF